MAGRQPVPLQMTQVQELPPITVSPGTDALSAATKAAGTAPVLRGQAKSSAPPPVDEGFHDAGSTIAALERRGIHDLLPTILGAVEVPIPDAVNVPIPPGRRSRISRGF